MLGGCDEPAEPPGDGKVGMASAAESGKPKLDEPHALQPAAVPLITDPGAYEAVTTADGSELPTVKGRAYPANAVVVQVGAA